MRFAGLLLLACACLRGEQAAIEGAIVNATTGTPLAGVHVRLVSFQFSGPGEAYGAMSDRAGHFSIASVRPGTYVLIPERTGFVMAPKKSGGAAIPNVTLKSGERLAGYQIEMVPRAVIAGRVIDEYGDPVQNASVQAVPVSPESAPVNLTGTGNATTDDRGEFRISGPPGSFYVKVTPQQARLGGPPEIRTDGSSPATYGTTFFPNAAAQDRASAVEARAGEDITGIEVRLARTQALSISGVVNGLPEGSRATVTAQFGRRGEQFTSSTSTFTGTDGRFSFPSLQTGPHRLHAQVSVGKATLHSQFQDVQLEGAAVSGVELMLSPGIELAGTLNVSGDAPPGETAAKRTVRLVPVAAQASYSAPGAEVDSAGSFRLTGVPAGRVTVQVDPMPANGYVKSVTLDGVAGKGDVIEVPPGARGSTLKVTVSRTAGEISGIIQDQDGTPLANHISMVFLIRDPNVLRMEDMTRVAPDAKYTLKNIPPGKYRLFALDAFRYTGRQGLDDLKELAAGAEEVEVKENDRITRNLNPIEKGVAGNAKPKP